MSGRDGLVMATKIAQLCALETYKKHPVRTCLLSAKSRSEALLRMTDCRKTQLAEQIFFYYAAYKIIYRAPVGLSREIYECQNPQVGGYANDFVLAM